MDKSSPVGCGLADEPRHAHQPRPPKTNAIRIAAIASGLILYFSFPSFIPLGDRPPSLPSSPLADPEFDWLQIVPQEQFVYHPCFGGYQCARLSVPINWNDTANPARAAIAVIKVPAKVPVTDPCYGGAIVLNPGGPGNSGIGQVLRKGRHMQTIVDATYPASDPDGLSDGKYFDIIGFDARAVNNTTPHLTCFPNKQSELNFLARQPSDFLFGISNTYIDLAWANYRAFGESCAIQHGDEPNMAEFANTAQVVEDIVAMIERHAEWREVEAQQIISLCDGSKFSESDRERILDTTRWQKGSEKLNYWGVSYGTILGQTFSVMHPDRVSRVLIDGVVDPDDYYSANWLKNLQDTDQILQQWASYCNQAPEACPLASPHTPPSIINDQKLVEPYFELFSDLLLDRNGTSTATLKMEGDLTPLSLNADCIKDGSYSAACVRDQGPSGFFAAIACGDGPDLRNTSKAEFREYFEEVRGQSDVLGAAWSGHRMLCINWQARPAWRVEGPWTANTSYPLLIIGNTYDPVTPLRNAHRVSTLFPGSVVLHQNTEGHGLHASPSICTGKAVRAYFQDGTLPEIDTVCEPEYRAWIGCVNPDGCDGRSDEDQALWEALSGMNQNYQVIASFSALQTRNQLCAATGKGLSRCAEHASEKEPLIKGKLKMQPATL
ncbi:putative hydrolase [Colletotrichum aenigma]|uniref:putative hydrolase n=1 Tax=Colletotrichum aenigma TaxID=1215731 RepID=UPI00187246CB|nr:putative hydrolase [Colletotrichum aenigma]KAF5523262.1 putative hydrolase [Colletotrichum aenigma]